jgi:hypothetical protein
MSIAEKDKVYDNRKEGCLGPIDDDALFSTVICYLKAAKNINIIKDAVSKVVEDKKNGRVTVYFSDGKKTESICKEGDNYDFMIGFANCVMMWMTGNYTGFCSKLKKNKAKFISVDELRAKKEVDKKTSGNRAADKKTTESGKHSK